MLDAIMEFVKVGNKGKFHSAVYHRFLQSIVSCFVIVNCQFID